MNLSDLQAKYKALQMQIEDKYLDKEPPVELQESLKNAILEYQTAKAEAEKEADKKLENKGVVVTMNKKQMKNQIFKAMLKGQDFTDEMRASGIELPRLMDSVGETGQVGAVNNRGGYLVSEEFMDVDIYGGDVRPVPAREIAVTKPTGKIPTFNLSQAKENNKFLVAFDELDTIAKKQIVFGQLDYTTVDKAGIIPLSNRILDDASDVLGMVMSALATADAYQRNQDIITALLSAVSQTRYSGANTDFDDVEGIDALIKAVRVDLTGVNRHNAVIVTCDTVFGKIATAKNEDGDYYLRPMATDPARFQIDGVEVIAIDDSHFTSSNTLTECALVGNFDRVAFIHRQGMEISTSAEAGFTSDALLVRGTKRSVVKVLEAGAFVKVLAGANPEG